MGMFANQDRKKSAFEEYLDNLPMPGIGDDPASTATPVQGGLDISRLTVSPDYLQLLAGGTSPLPTTSVPALRDPSLAPGSPLLGLPQSGPSFGDITPADLAAREFSDPSYSSFNGRQLGTDAFAPNPAALSLPSVSDGGESFGRDAYGWAFDPATAQAVLDGTAGSTLSFAGPANAGSAGAGGGLVRSMANAVDGAASAVGDALVAPAEAAKMPRKSDGAEPSDSVRRAILHASHVGGVSPRMMFNIAKRESTFQPDKWAIKKDGTRGAGFGLYQNQPGMWMENIHKHGAEYGLGKIAKAIYKIKGTDNYTTGDKSVDDRVLSFRSNPYLSALIAIARMKGESSDVAAVLGHKAPTEADMYSVHFMGKKGAMGLAKAARLHPDKPAYLFNEPAAKNNHNMFHDRSGRPYSVREFWDNLQDEMGS